MARSQASSTITAPAAPIASFDYTYDGAGRVIGEIGLGVTTTYTYDADSEVTSQTSSLAKSSYTYDADGNRIGGDNVVGPDNQLLSDGIWDYSYDADGNLVKEVAVTGGPDTGLTWTYTYNNQNQMLSAVETNNISTLETETYIYDVFGNRIEQDTTSNGSPTQVTRFAYDGQNIWADLNGSNTLVTRRVYLPSSLGATVRGSRQAQWPGTSLTDLARCGC